MTGAGAIDSVSDLVLLTLLENEQQGAHELAGTTRLQKLLFLLVRSPEYVELSTQGLAPAVSFEPYRMGPFTPEVYRAVDVLADFKPELVVASRGSWERADDVELDRYIDETDLDRSEPAVSSDPRPTRYELTQSGRRVAQHLARSAPPAMLDVLRRVIREYGSLSLNELLRRVYAEYPDMTTKSEIRAQLGFE